MRNNQRRSRARRKEYVAELEAKVRRYEASESPNTMDRSVQLLIKENHTLRRLLHSMGLGNDFIAAYIKASGTALEMSNTVAQPDLHAQLDDATCSRTESYSSHTPDEVSELLNSTCLLLTNSAPEGPILQSKCRATDIALTCSTHRRSDSIY